MDPNLRAVRADGVVLAPLRANGTSIGGLTAAALAAYEVPLHANGSLAVLPAAHFSGVVRLFLVATAREAMNGANRSAVARVDVLVSPVADAPTLAIAAGVAIAADDNRAATVDGVLRGVEDVATVVPIDALALVDTDGSEALQACVAHCFWSFVFPPAEPLIYMTQLQRAAGLKPMNRFNRSAARARDVRRADRGRARRRRRALAARAAAHRR